jgi:hypothetical protein
MECQDGGQGFATGIDNLSTVLAGEQDEEEAWLQALIKRGSKRSLTYGSRTHGGTGGQWTQGGSTGNSHCPLPGADASISRGALFSLPGLGTSRIKIRPVHLAVVAATLRQRPSCVFKGPGLSCRQIDLFHHYLPTLALDAP